MAVVLVVMEPGSDWPGQVGDAETLVALRADEDMLGATRDRLATLERGRQHVSVAVLACNGATDGATAGRRVEVASTLLASVSRFAWGRLVLTASAAPVSERLRQHLLSLAGRLMRRPGGTNATVTLKFTDARDHERIRSWPPSGVHRAMGDVLSLAV